MREPLSTDEAIEMIDAMVTLAQKDAALADIAENRDDAHYWDGWAQALLVLKIHIATGVKASCYPLGSCACHPVTFREGR